MLAAARPMGNFVVCRLEPETMGPILAEVFPERRAIDRIIHIQIEKNGALAFGRDGVPDLHGQNRGRGVA